MHCGLVCHWLYSDVHCAVPCIACVDSAVHCGLIYQHCGLIYQQLGLIYPQLGLIYQHLNALDEWTVYFEAAHGVYPCGLICQHCGLICPQLSQATAGWTHCGLMYTVQSCATPV